MTLKDTLLEKNYSLLASNGYYSYESGIKPVLIKVNEDIAYFKDLTVVDKIVGKASASLLALSGVKEVYALTLSLAGREVLEKYGISYQYDQLVDHIENRNRDGMCPMEMTVKDIDDPAEALIALNAKIASLKQ